MSTLHSIPFHCLSNDPQIEEINTLLNLPDYGADNLDYNDECMTIFVPILVLFITKCTVVWVYERSRVIIIILIAILINKVV